MTNHADLEVVVNKVPYGDVFGAETEKSTMTLKEYINTYMTDEYVSCWLNLWNSYELVRYKPQRNVFMNPNQ